MSSQPSLNPFEVKHAAVSCTVSGELIPVGTIGYAENYDQLRNGGGLCEREYKRLTAPKRSRKPKKETG